MAQSHKVKRILLPAVLLVLLAAVWLGVSIHRSATELTVVNDRIPTAKTEKAQQGWTFSTV